MGKPGRCRLAGDEVVPICRLPDISSADWACGSEAPLVAKRCEKRDHGGLEHGAPMLLSLGDDGPATAIRFCRFFANVEFDGGEERGKRVEISERPEIGRASCRERV